MEILAAYFMNHFPVSEGKWMITSKKNPRIQFIRSLLQDRKIRDDSGQFIIEGVRLVEEAAADQSSIQEIFYTQSLSERGNTLLEHLQTAKIPIEEVDENIFLSLMDTSTSQGIAAICKKTDKEIPDNMDFVIIADQLRDPGNMGTLLRTAAAAGAQAVFTTPGSVDLYSPKVVRSAMGAHFHIFCAELDWERLQDIKENNTFQGITSYVAAADAQSVYWNCDFTQPALIIIGNEADGASDNAFHLADHRVSIPMPGDFESLNAAVAAGIIIFEIVRQRTNINKILTTH
jgi:RNA methyltransferase, TrmH family